MNNSKFVNPLTVSILGIVLTIVAAVLIFTLLINGTNAALQTQTGIYNANSQYLGAGPKAQADKAVADAKTQVQAVNAQWNHILLTKNPDIDFSDRLTAWKQYINEVDFVLGPKVERWFPTTGIKPTAGITTPNPPTDPNAVVTTSPIVIPLNGGSNIQVIGSFSQILKHVSAWNSFPRIVLVNGLALQGISPYLQGTYTATVYEFPRNANTVGIALPTGSSAGGASGPPSNQPPSGGAQVGGPGGR